MTEKKEEVVVVINPGSTSTKFAIFSRNDVLYEDTVRHPQEELSKFDLVTEQFDFRYKMIKEKVDEIVKLKNLNVVGVVGRGGPVKPVEGGTYLINETLLNDLKSCKYANHASNLGGMIANKMSLDYDLKESYIVDPVTTDNMWEKARISGFPGIERACRVHALNIKKTARKIAEKIGRDFESSKFVVAHLGGGISIAAVDGGKIVDVNDGLLGMGPFSPERAGALPIRGLMKLCYSKPESEVKKLLSKESGFKGYLGVSDFRDVLKLLEENNQDAKRYYDAFVYQIAKEIGSYIAGMKNDVHGVIITGGIAYSERFIKDIKSYIEGMKPVYVYPGENELEALAEGAFRVIDKEEEPKIYE